MRIQGVYGAATLGVTPLAVMGPSRGPEVMTEQHYCTSVVYILGFRKIILSLPNRGKKIYIFITVTKYILLQDHEIIFRLVSSWFSHLQPVIQC